MTFLKPSVIALSVALAAAGAIGAVNAQSASPKAGHEESAEHQHDKDKDQSQGRGRPDRKMSKEDRSAFMNARIAAVHAGLALTPEQEKLWPPVETAAREMMASMSAAMENMRAGKPKDKEKVDMIERMKQRAEMQIARGQAMKKMADAAAPLYASLTQQQKDRLPRLLRPGMRGKMGRWMGEHGMHRMHGRHRHDD